MVLYRKYYMYKVLERYIPISCSARYIYIYTIYMYVYIYIYQGVTKMASFASVSAEINFDVSIYFRGQFPARI